jgi:hypothetical protein
MPFKVWAVGEEVLAADFNDYLQEQIVATFPTTAARDAAITAPNEGQLAYVSASKQTYRWNGTAWVGQSVKVSARQTPPGLGAAYDPNVPVQIHTAYLGVTTDAAGYVIVTFSTLGMPLVPAAVFVVIPQCVSAWNTAFWIAQGSSVTAAQIRFLTGAGAPLASTAINIAVTILYQ